MQVGLSFACGLSILGKSLEWQLLQFRHTTPPKTALTVAKLLGKRYQLELIAALTVGMFKIEIIMLLGIY